MTINSAINSACATLEVVLQGMWILRVIFTDWPVYSNSNSEFATIPMAFGAPLVMPTSAA